MDSTVNQDQYITICKFDTHVSADTAKAKASGNLKQLLLDVGVTAAGEL